MPRENSFSDGASGRSLTPDLPNTSLQTSTATAVDQTPPRTIPIPLRPTIVTTENAGDPKPRPSNASSGLRPRTAAGDKFRVVVRRVMSMHRTRKILSTAIGAEPGIDVRRMTVGAGFAHLREDCYIQIADYSATKVSIGRMSNKTFIQMMSDSKASEKDSWVKVRWIAIGGISWDVISTLAIRYDLHPLAVEDVIARRHGQSHRSKSDYYLKHLFLNVLCHILGDEEDVSDLPALSPENTLGLDESEIEDKYDADILMPRSESPDLMTVEEEEDADKDQDAWSDGQAGDNIRRSSKAKPGPSQTTGFLRRRFNKTTVAAPDLERRPGGDGMLKGMSQRFRRNDRRKDEATLAILKKGDRINVEHSSLCIFHLRDGTVITIHPTPTSAMFSPLFDRLRTQSTVLRTSADPSMLVQAVLDLVVDRALEVVDAYHNKILKMEKEVLLKPKISTIRSLHILSGELIMHKRTLEPVKTLIYGLRRYDEDRAAALMDVSSPVGPRPIQRGFMSHKAKIYLADVHDHCEHILSSMDMFAAITENLINFTFNTASNEMNVVMRRLTLITIICLPLSLLTGYFGMNFPTMWSLTFTDVFYWIIALPLLAILVPIFAWQDFKAMFHYFHKKTETRKVAKVSYRWPARADPALTDVHSTIADNGRV